MSTPPASPPLYTSQHHSLDDVDGLNLATVNPLVLPIAIPLCYLQKNVCLKKLKINEKEAHFYNIFTVTTTATAVVTTVATTKTFIYFWRQQQKRLFYDQQGA